MALSEPLSRSKRVFFSFVMVLLTCGLSFVVLEFGLAAYYTDTQSTNWSRFDTRRGWALVPGDYWVKPIQRMTSFPLHINGAGLREDRELPAAKTGAQVVVLGDSFTFAKETRTEKMFTTQLERLLAEHAPGVSVVNAGVPGYGTAQQLLFMRELRDTHNIKPDVYLVVFFTNDILDNLCLSYGNLAPQPVRPCFSVTESGEAVPQHSPEERFDSQDETLVEAQPSGLRTVSLLKAAGEEWLQTRPGLVALITQLGVRPQVARMPAILNGWYRQDVAERGMALTRALIRQLHKEGAANGARLMVSMVPSPFQVYPDTYVPVLQKSFPGDPIVEGFASDLDRPERMVRQICAEDGIPFQDLLPVFVKNNDKTLFVPRDGHLNDAGHDVVSTSLAAFVSTHWPADEN